MKNEDKIIEVFEAELMALKKAMSYLDTIMDNSMDGIVLTDNKGFILKINKYFIELLSCKQDDVIGEHISKYGPKVNTTYKSTTGESVHIDDKFFDETAKMYEQFVEKKQPIIRQAYFVSTNDILIPVEQNISFFYDEKGNIVGALAIIRDISERKMDENKLRESEERARAILNTPSDIALLMDCQGIILDANEALSKTYKKSRDELIGTSSFDLLTRKVAKERKSFLDRVIQTGKPIHFEDHHYGRFYEHNIHPIINKQGKVNSAAVITRDITERKQVEEALKQSEEKHYKLIENANDAIVSVNTKGMIIGYNKKAEEMFGYSSEDVLGKSSYALISHRNKDFYKDALVHFAQTGTSLVCGSNILQGRAVKKSGVEFDVEYSYYTINIKGEYISTAIIRDITKRKIAEQKLIEYQQKLKSLASQLTLTEEKERRRFAEFLHNEIGQNLFAIQLQLQQLKHSLTSADNIKTINNILDNLKQTINHSRSLTFELSSPILYELGLEKALEWLVDEMSQKYNIAVTFSDDKKKKPADDDAKIFIYQAVRELLTNVVKHAQVEKASVSIRKNNSSMVICVEDNGHGFDPSCLETLDNMKDQFGLFHINERIKQLGGRIKIKSQPDGGTKITITVPLKM
jgi:PAS domain S-box-containing protein